MPTHLGSALSHTINDDEIRKKKKNLHLKTLLFSILYIYIYICRIQIVQKIVQL
jgi:hypothetical protein